MRLAVGQITFLGSPNAGPRSDVGSPLFGQIIDDCSRDRVAVAPSKRPRYGCELGALEMRNQRGPLVTIPFEASIAVHLLL